MSNESFEECKLKISTTKLLEAAHDFDREQKAFLRNQDGSVKWVDFENGELLIFTKSEYKKQLMANIEGIYSSPTHFFSNSVDHQQKKIQELEKENEELKKLLGEAELSMRDALGIIKKIGYDVNILIPSVVNFLSKPEIQKNLPEGGSVSMYCERCGEMNILNQELCDSCKDEIFIQNMKKDRLEKYNLSSLVFDWRYGDCHDGFVFRFKDFEYTNLAKLSDSINIELKTKNEKIEKLYFLMDKLSNFDSHSSLEAVDCFSELVQSWMTENSDDLRSYRMSKKEIKEQGE